MLRAKEVQLLVRLAELGHKSIQYGRVGLHNKIHFVSHIVWNKGALRPTFVVRSETAVPALFLDGIGQHPIYPLEAKLLHHFLSTVSFEVHSVKALPDTLLNGLFAGNVGLVAGPPEGDIAFPPGGIQAVGVEIGIILQFLHPPVPIS